MKKTMVAILMFCFMVGIAFADVSAKVLSYNDAQITIQTTYAANWALQGSLLLF